MGGALLPTPKPNIYWTYWILSIGPGLSVGLTVMLLCHGSCWDQASVSSQWEVAAYSHNQKRMFTWRMTCKQLGCLAARHCTHTLFGWLLIQYISLFSSVWIDFHGWCCLMFDHKGISFTWPLHIPLNQSGTLCQPWLLMLTRLQFGHGPIQAQ